MRTVRGATDDDHRGAPAGRARAPLSRWGSGGDPACTCCPRSSDRAASSGRTRRRPRASTAATCRDRGHRSAPALHPSARRARRAAPEQGMLPAISFIFSRAACDDAVKQCLAAGMRLTNSDERRELRRDRGGHVEALSRGGPRRARPRRVAGRVRGRHRRAPRRAGPADEGSGRGGVRGRARQGRVRDRDALAGHQHAGPVGRHREALEVHRRAPRVPDAGGVHPADRAGGPAGDRPTAAKAAYSASSDGTSFAGL